MIELNLSENKGIDQAVLSEPKILRIVREVNAVWSCSLVKALNARSAADSLDESLGTNKTAL